MKYAVLIYEPPSDFELRDTSDVAAKEAYWGGWSAYSQAVAEAGVMAGGAALQPYTTGTTVKLRDGERHVQDGPYADTKEQLGGFYILDVPDLDAALEWAAKCPAAATGVVEVRPVLPMNEDAS